MPRYKTYNRMYYKGKAIGKPFLDFTNLKAKNKTDAENIARKRNASWNKIRTSRGYRAKLIKVKKK